MDTLYICQYSDSAKKYEANGYTVGVYFCNRHHYLCDLILGMYVLLQAFMFLLVTEYSDGQNY